MTQIPEITGLGEALIRLSAPEFERLERANSLSLRVGGAELNTLTCVAGLGGGATFVTRMADNPLGRRINSHIAEFRVRQVVQWEQASRTPLYFVEHGVAPRSSEVFYDRESSAMTRLAEDSFDWVNLLRSSDIAYATGITCALGQGPQVAVQSFFEEALKQGKRSAFDLNYRSKLWTWAEATECVRSILPKVSILFASAKDLKEIFSADGDPIRQARQVIEQFGAEIVVLRETMALGQRGVSVRATAITASQICQGDSYDAVVVDAFGAGDAAAGAFLHSVAAGQDLSQACNMAALACAVQHTVLGDAWQFSLSEIERLQSDSRRILR